MVVSEIWSLYCDENDLPRTVTKRIYEEKRSQLWIGDPHNVCNILKDGDL